MTNEATTHIDALQLRLSHERVRLSLATKASEIALRSVWVAQMEKELVHAALVRGEVEMSDDDLLALLAA